MIDLAVILPEELFDGMPQKPEGEIARVEFSAYASNCPELLGNFTIELFKNDKGEYYVARKEQEPIGDYGSHCVHYWYRCNNNEAVNTLISAAQRERSE